MTLFSFLSDYLTIRYFYQRARRLFNSRTLKHYCQQFFNSIQIYTYIYYMHTTCSGYSHVWLNPLVPWSNNALCKTLSAFYETSHNHVIMYIITSPLCADLRPSSLSDDSARGVDKNGCQSNSTRRKWDSFAGLTKEPFRFVWRTMCRLENLKAARARECSKRRLATFSGFFLSLCVDVPEEWFRYHTALQMEPRVHRLDRSNRSHLWYFCWAKTKWKNQHK